MYCGFKSECAVKDALVSRHPRDSFTLADKLHAGFLKTKEDRDRIFNEQRRKTGVEYFDYYLLHDIGADHYKVYTELDCFTWLQEKKAQGLVRHIGFSFHDNAELLDRVLTEHPEVEFVQLQLNYLDWTAKACSPASAMRPPSSTARRLLSWSRSRAARWPRCPKPSRRCSAPTTPICRCRPGHPLCGQPGQRHGRFERHEHAGAGAGQHELHGAAAPA